MRLASCLKALRAFLLARGVAPPTWDLEIVEIGPSVQLDGLGRLRIARKEIRTATEYSARFDELMSTSLPWLNITCYGVDGPKLLVGVETPTISLARSTRTLVNYSGPAASVILADWTMDSVLVIEE